MRNIETSELKQVSKRTARKLYNEGITVYLVPSNLYPDFNGVWIQPFGIDKNRPDELPENLDFDKRVNNFEYYNCNCNEFGYYSNFYIRK